jgi:hypothetical protein
VQAILIAVSDTGGSWVGWVILAVIFGFIAWFLFGDMRARLRNRLIKRRSRYQVPSSPPPSNNGQPFRADHWTDEQH